MGCKGNSFDTLMNANLAPRSDQTTHLHRSTRRARWEETDQRATRRQDGCRGQPSPEPTRPAGEESEPRFSRPESACGAFSSTQPSGEGHGRAGEHSGMSRPASADGSATSCSSRSPVTALAVPMPPAAHSATTAAAHARAQMWAKRFGRIRARIIHPTDRAAELIQGNQRPQEFYRFAKTNAK